MDSMVQLCGICGDRATGRHYGALSCDGCKGFFRRSVRKRSLYCCRFDRCCLVDKDKRNQCRHCRLKKCFKAGMKQEAVQNERDRNVCIPLYRNEHFEQNCLTASNLLAADIMSRDSVYVTRDPQSAQNLDIRKCPVARMMEICASIQNQLLLMVEWAKKIPAFIELPEADQFALLRAHAGENLLLGVVRRSLSFKDVLLLGNNCVVTNHAQDRRMDVEISKVGMRVVNEIINPMKDINVDETEIAFLKAILLFDPNVKNLLQSGTVRSLRRKIQTNLEEYMKGRQCDARGRIFDLLLCLPPLQSIAWQMIEHIHLAKLFDVVPVDKLLLDMLLGDTTPDTTAVRSTFTVEGQL